VDQLRAETREHAGDTRTHRLPVAQCVQLGGLRLAVNLEMVDDFQEIRLAAGILDVDENRAPRWWR
jgi:hypothetical protein